MVDLKQYSKAMGISQVVTFFERQGLAFTQSAIHNYVKIGLLPPPKGRSRYTHDHLRFLYMISYLKDCFALDEIRQAFLSMAGVGFCDCEDSCALAMYEDFTACLAGEAGSGGMLYAMCQSVRYKKDALELLNTTKVGIDI